MGLGPCVLLSDPAISDLLSKAGFQYLAFLASGSAAKPLTSEHIQWLHYHHLGLESPSLKEALKGAGWYVQKKQSMVGVEGTREPRASPSINRQSLMSHHRARAPRAETVLCLSREAEGQLTCPQGMPLKRFFLNKEPTSPV